jgi:6-phosphofructokinase 1
MRLGILTGGGDCPGLNAVIRAAVVRSIRTYESQIVGFLDGWVGVLEGHTRELSLDSISGILPRGGTVLGTSRVDPARREGGIAAVKDAVRIFGLNGLIVCGGEGTLSSAADLSDAGVPIIGVPKTIDNDVRGTDYSFGFDTALETVVRAIDAVHSTAEAHDRVIVVEVMGRSVGWIAICSALAGGGDVVVAPEVPMNVTQVCDAIRVRRARGRKFSIVVVAEGAEMAPEPDGTKLEIPHRTDEFGRPRYGGIGNVLAHTIEQRLGMETRTVTLGYVQRGGTPSAFDRLLGTRMGIHAVDLAARSEFGRMVSLQGTSVTSVPLSVVREGPRPVDENMLEAYRAFFG